MTTAVLNEPKTDSVAIPSHARLAIWLNKLPQNPLPIDTTIAKQILRTLRDEDCDCLRLAELIKQDPILCLKLFHCTEDAMKGRDGDIQHIAHLVSLLGFGKLERIIRNSQCKQAKQEGFQEILSASLFAAHLSSELLAKKHGASNERFFLPTLFFNAPLWLMWVAAPKTLSQGQVQASREQQSYLALSVKKLGFHLPDLLSKAQTFIHLPENTLKALEINPKDNMHFWAKAHHYSGKKLDTWLQNNKQARHQFYSVETGIYLLNQYIIAVYLDWSGKHIQRYATLLCHYLNMSQSELNTVVIDAAMHVKTPRHIDRLFKPINRLHGLHREGEAQGNALPTKTQPLSIEAWLHKIRQCTDVDNALQCTLEALSKGVGVDHCIIMEVGEEDIHTQAHYGFTAESAIESFQQQRNQAANLFTQLTQKPACISISSQDLPKAARKIPQQFVQHCHLQPCGLLSVFHHNKPKAIIYCDHQQWDQQTHQHFKMVGKNLSMALKQL